MSPELKKWLWNVFVFAVIPAVVVLLTEAVKLIPATWQYGVVVVFIVNAIIDGLRKWQESRK